MLQMEQKGKDSTSLSSDREDPSKTLKRIFFVRFFDEVTEVMRRKKKDLQTVRQTS